MRRVIDQIFCETLEFTVSDEQMEDQPELRREAIMSKCRHDYFVAMAAIAGIELIEYDSARAERRLHADWTRFELHSKAYNAKALL